ncbi:MAG: DNA primase DnaG [Thermofilaceae archaeon]|nr:DNA primase DnaG [Thermofilaceae archaeon]MDW8003618.1 DNA primase DnaG [Thermofilaceae archaeon]
MGGLPVNAKYVIHAKVEIDGIVDKADIVGALFGQTEGLLGSELDLRELQNIGRIGRIEVIANKTENKIKGVIKVPSNMSRVETSLIAATLETVDRVGPYSAKIEIVRIEDVRAEKRKRIIERAKELLLKLEEESPETKELIEEVTEAFKIAELTYYGPEKLPAGPEVETSETVIVVEGRADVLNLLKHGYKNVVALEGASIPKSVIELSKKKKIILFVDGDRGGELIARNVLSVITVDSVARAPSGREVEELSGKEIAKALKNKVSVKEFMESLKFMERIEEGFKEIEKPSEVVDFHVTPQPVVELHLPQKIIEEARELRGTLEALLYDSEWKQLKRVAVRDLSKELSELENISYVVFDGVVTQRLVDIAGTKGVKAILGARIGDVVRQPDNVIIKTFDDLKIT